MILARTTVDTNKVEGAGSAHGQIRLAQALRRIFPTALASYLAFRGWIR